MKIQESPVSAVNSTDIRQEGAPAMLKIIGRRTSANVMKPLWAADELGLDYDRVDVGGKFGGNREPGYLAINPMGLVPTLVEDDFTLWESNAITRYLCGKYGRGSLCPAYPWVAA